MSSFADGFAERTIDQEARGEGPLGELAVAHVLLNRQATKRWGTTLASVVDAWEQFSGWNKGDPNRARSLELPDDDPGLLRAAAALAQARAEHAKGIDPTGGATHYYAVTLTTPPDWVTGNAARGIKPATFTVQIGRQRFYKNVP